MSCRQRHGATVAGASVDGLRWSRLRSVTMSTLVAVLPPPGFRRLEAVLNALTCGQRMTRAMTIAVAGVSLVTAANVYGVYASGVRGWLFAMEVAVGVLSCALVPVLFRYQVTGALLLAG